MWHTWMIWSSVHWTVAGPGRTLQAGPRGPDSVILAWVGGDQSLGQFWSGIRIKTQSQSQWHQWNGGYLAKSIIGPRACDHQSRPGPGTLKRVNRFNFWRGRIDWNVAIPIGWTMALKIAWNSALFLTKLKVPPLRLCSLHSIVLVWYLILAVLADSWFQVKIAASKRILGQSIRFSLSKIIILQFAR